MLLLMVFSIATAYNQNIISAEYFFDTDPGCGNGTPITISTPAETVNFSTSISSNMLSGGFHMLGVRVRDANGKWSMFDRRGIYISTPTTNISNITAAEYFYDLDPGPGNGIPVPVGTAGEAVNFTAVIPAPINPGFHFLAIRTRNADGKWGMFERRGFYISPAPVDMPVITAAEYFYDNDPGVGNGTALAITSPGNILAQNFMIPVPASMSPGGHLLAIRVRNQAGHWSLFEKDSLTVGAASDSIRCPGNVTVNALSDQCVAKVNNLDPVVTQGSSYTYALTGATTGNGNGSASGLLFNVGVTTVTYSLANSPDINCSFTVTVYPSAPTSVSVLTPVTSICSGTEVLFSALPVNGGFTPTYQWQKNGMNTGINSKDYIDSTLVNGDVITVIMTSSLGCANPLSDTSSPITMSVTETVTPAVNIAATASTICPGQQVTFTATPTNGGNNPTYEWMRNGQLVGTNSTYQSSTLANGDSVFVRINSSAYCTYFSQAESNVIYITVSQLVTPSVNISASETTICPGQQVTFTATPINGGETPVYEWTLNNNAVGSNSNIFQTSALQNGDVVRVTMSPSLNCGIQNPVYSNPITITVDSAVASVSISASAIDICSGTPVTFTATPTNGGNAPFYQWKLNGNNVGSNSATYQNSTLANGDSVKVLMTSSLACTNQRTASSNTIAMDVSAPVTPSVSIITESTSICVGQAVIFTATPTNGGFATYQWKLNGNNVGGNSTIYQTTTLQDGDSVTVVMGSSLGCASPQTATSNVLIMKVGSSVTPSVSIEASQSTICSGQMVTFTATPTNGGANPVYEWTLNNNAVGSDSNIYQSPTLKNGDVVRVTMSSSLLCASQNPVGSNSITITTDTTIEPSVRINASATSICAGSPVLFTATPTNGGTPTYQWKVNGVNVGSNSDTYQCTDLVNADVVSVVMKSSLVCANPQEVVSNSINILVQTRVTYYRDLDGDGYGSTASGSTQACTIIPGYSIMDGDCNDNDASVNPGSPEICGNSNDENCSGAADENCSNDLPQLALRTYPIKEGNSGQTIFEARISLDRPAPLAVQLSYATSNIDAISGMDYVETSGTLTIPAGAIHGIVQIRIIGDTYRESNERFWLQFSNPINVNIASTAQCQVMIIDDDKRIRNSSIAGIEKMPDEDLSLKIPSVTRRNHVWVIPEIERYENEVLVIDAQGQLVSRFVNYRNHTPLGNFATGLYFYQVQVVDETGRKKYYKGRLLITE